MIHVQYTEACCYMLTTCTKKYVKNVNAGSIEPSLLDQRQFVLHRHSRFLCVQYLVLYAQYVVLMRNTLFFVCNTLIFVCNSLFFVCNTLFFVCNILLFVCNTMLSFCYCQPLYTSNLDFVRVREDNHKNKSTCGIL